MRPLTAALSLANNNIVLTGEPRMKERPIGHLVDALREGGATIDYLEQENYPPFAYVVVFLVVKYRLMALSLANF